MEDEKKKKKYYYYALTRFYTHPVSILRLNLVSIRVLLNERNDIVMSLIFRCFDRERSNIYKKYLTLFSNK